MEIERKYLIRRLPIDVCDCNYKKIEQSYLSYQPEVRLRMIGDDYKLTIKSGLGLSRTEVELDIEELQYNELKELSISNIIKKTRYFIKTSINHCDYLLELDVYDDLDLITVEVEFRTIDESNIFNRIKPDWLDIEITYVDKFKNHNLAKII